MTLGIEANKKQWGKLLDGVSEEVRKILTDADTESHQPFVACLNEMKEITTDIVKYLPPGEKTDLLDICASWLDIGLIFGKAPKRLAEIIEESGARVKNRK